MFMNLAEEYENLCRTEDLILSINHNYIVLNFKYISVETKQLILVALSFEIPFSFKIEILLLMVYFDLYFKLYTMNNSIE